mgnify:FL=1
MAHFAHLNSENKVIRISVVSNDIETSDGPLGENDMHVDGETWCQNFHSGKPWTVDNGIVSWKQCSYGGSFRKAYPQIGATYDSVRDEFVQLQPYPSWTLNATNDWVSPLANNPSSGSGPHGTIWQEDNQRWVSFRAEGQENPDVWNPSTQQWDLA